jgi:hypothetical protein
MRRRFPKLPRLLEGLPVELRALLACAMGDELGHHLPLTWREERKSIPLGRGAATKAVQPRDIPVHFHGG